MKIVQAVAQAGFQVLNKKECLKNIINTFYTLHVHNNLNNTDSVVVAIEINNAHCNCIL